jgi:hypothetical protein
VRRRRIASLFAAGLILLSLAAAGTVTAKGHLNVLLEDLSSPKGILAGPKSVFVSQGWAGPPGPVLEWLRTGRNRGTAVPVTDPIPLVDIAGTADGAGWGIGTDGWLYRQAAPGAAPEAILDIFGYQAADPDENDVPAPSDQVSNPFSLAGLWTNEVLIADAAGNDLLRAGPDGSAVTVARWLPRLIPNTIPGLPNPMLAEAAPTTVAIGRDGWAYVGELVGFPGTPGTALIWRVNPFAEDAVCSVDVADPNCSVWKAGFTSIMDIAFNPRNGTLYVYEIAEDGWLAFEAGFGTGEFPPAVLLQVKGHKTRELVRGQLSQPGGVSIAPNGAIYVTDGMFTGGRLIQLTGS